jgi:hypothetical protein
MGAVAVGATLLTACSTSVPDLPGFDSAAFRADRHGCSGYRDAQRAVIRGVATKFLGLREPQISALLGRPDAAELGDRGQRVYLYNLTPGPMCGASTRTIEPTLLRVRFNAVDKVSEALVID